MNNSSVIGKARKRLVRFKGRYPLICERAGLGYSWLSKFSRGERGLRPSFDLIQRLLRVLDEMEAEAKAAKANAAK